MIAEADVKKAAGDYRGAYLLYSVAYQILSPERLSSTAIDASRL